MMADNRLLEQSRAVAQDPDNIDLLINTMHAHLHSKQPMPHLLPNVANNVGNENLKDFLFENGLIGFQPCDFHRYEKLKKNFRIPSAELLLFNMFIIGIEDHYHDDSEDFKFLIKEKEVIARYENKLEYLVLKDYFPSRIDFIQYYNIISLSKRENSILQIPQKLYQECNRLNKNFKMEFFYDSTGRNNNSLFENHDLTNRLFPRLEKFFRYIFKKNEKGDDFKSDPFLYGICKIPNKQKYMLNNLFLENWQRGSYISNGIGRDDQYKKLLLIPKKSAFYFELHND